MLNAYWCQWSINEWFHGQSIALVHEWLKPGGPFPHRLHPAAPGHIINGFFASPGANFTAVEAEHPHTRSLRGAPNLQLTTNQFLHALINNEHSHQTCSSEHYTNQHNQAITCSISL